MKRNDIIAAIIGSGLLVLAISGKLDWPAAVAYIIGWLQRQPTVMSPPALDPSNGQLPPAS